MGKCKIRGCNDPSRALGMCKYHYGQRYRQKKICSIKECDSQVKAKGFCSKHYQIHRQKNIESEPAFKLPSKSAPFLTDESIGDSCSVVGCDDAKLIGDLCKKHYEKMYWWTCLPEIKKSGDRAKFYNLQLKKTKKELADHLKLYELAANVQARMKFNFLIKLRKKALKKIEEELNRI